MPTPTLSVRSIRLTRTLAMGLMSCLVSSTAMSEEYTNLEIREASRLEDQLPEIANTPIVVPKDETKADTFLTETFTPIVDHIANMPVDLLEEAAAAHQRARVRLTSQTRGKKQPFRLAEDISENLSEYEFRPLTVYGVLEFLREVSLPDPDDDAPLRFGEMAYVESNGKLLRILVENMPDGLPTDSQAKVRVSATGFIIPVTFSGDTADTSEPVLVAPWLNWHQPSLETDLLADVKDRTVGIKPAERFPMMKTLAHARMIDYKAQQRLAEDVWRDMQQAIQSERAEKANPHNRQRSDILFVDLFKNPDLYRGKPVTLTGTLRSLAKWPNADVNGFEIDSVYEARIFPEDGQSNPVIVNFLENPARIPISDDLNRPVRFTGYFFKMYGYRDQADVLRVAPLFLGRQIEEVQIPSTDLADEWILIVGGGILTLIVAFVVWSRMSDRRFQKNWQSRQDEPDPDLSQLD